MKPRLYFVICAAVLISISSLVLLGWQLEIVTLKSILPQFVSMKANTAFCFLIIGFSLLLSRSKQTNLRRLELLCSQIPLLIGAATLVEYIFSVNLGIDEFLYRDPLAVGTRFPNGRMAPITALCFVMTSLSWVLQRDPQKSSTKTAQTLSLLIFILSFQAMVGYFLGLTYTFGYSYFTQMAFHTTLLFITTSLALFFQKPDSGFMLLFLSNSSSGKMLRRLLPFALVTPPLLNWLAMKGQSYGFIDDNFALMIRVIGASLIFTWIIWQSSSNMHAGEVQRMKAESDQLKIELERKAAEVIRNNEIRLRTIYETTHDAVVGIDEFGLVMDWNPQAEKIFGWEKWELLGKPLSDFIMPTKYRMAHEDGLKRYLKTREGHVVNRIIEITALRKSGEEFPVSLSITPIRLESGLYFTSFISDISERKRNEAELINARQAALVAAQVKTEFLANMSHEIRTPLNGIIGMTDLLLTTPMSETQKHYTQMLQDSGTGLLNIVNDILDFSKIEAGKLSLENLHFALSSLIESQVALLGPRAHKKGLDIYCMVDPAIPSELIGDSGRISQVLLNLMTNAIKFTEKGHVFIKANITTKSSSDVSIRICVRDTGIGLSEDAARKLFQPFVQADGSTARKFGGTGLGLSISRRLVELMGGKIGIFSKEGEGSEFWFTLTLKIAHENQNPKKDDEEPIKVLFIESDAILRNIVKSYLNSWGMQATTVNSLKDVEPVQLQNDIILMPSITANEDLIFAREVKSKGSSAKIILGSSLTETLESAHDEFTRLNRPYRQSELFNAIVTSIRGPQIQNIKAKKADMTQTRTAVGGHILVAEDNKVNQLLVQSLLRMMGFQALIVANGREVLEALKEDSYDLILMDCQMPEMDGYETTGAIRKLGLHIPIIALTANAMAEDRERCLAAGMDDYIAKPIKKDALLPILEKWLKQEDAA